MLLSKQQSLTFFPKHLKFVILSRYLETELSNAISLWNIMIGVSANGDIFNVVYHLIFFYSMPSIAYAKWNTNYILHFHITV